jgi:hypothetical protein
VLERLALVEHVLVERALVEARDGDRGDVVEVPDLHRVGEVDRVLRAADVQQRVGRLVRGHVVDRGEVEEVVDPLGDRLDAEPGLRQVAHDGLDPIPRAPALDQRVELLARALPHEDVDVPLTLEQPLDEVAADEPRGPGDEVAHAGSLRHLTRTVTTLE